VLVLLEAQEVLVLQGVLVHLDLLDLLALQEVLVLREAQEVLDLLV